MVAVETLVPGQLRKTPVRETPVPRSCPLMTHLVSSPFRPWQPVAAGLMPDGWLRGWLWVHLQPLARHRGFILAAFYRASDNQHLRALEMGSPPPAVPSGLWGCGRRSSMLKWVVLIINNEEVDPIGSRNSCSPNRLCHESMISTTECILKDLELNEQLAHKRGGPGPQNGDRK